VHYSLLFAGFFPTIQWMSFYEDKGDHIVLNIRVVPRASRDGFAEIMGDALKVRIQAPPVDGKANAYLVKFFSKQWKIPKSNIEILSGEAGRSKRLKISNPNDKIRKELLSLSDG
jgi:uncharacterized protein (TIGR00251 family)